MSWSSTEIVKEKLGLLGQSLSINAAPSQQSNIFCGPFVSFKHETKSLTVLERTAKASVLLFEEDFSILKELLN